MKIYKLNRYDKALSWGENLGFIVRASDEQEARRLGAEGAGYGQESPDTWLDPALSSCEEVTTEGPAEIILTDYQDE